MSKPRLPLLLTFTAGILIGFGTGSAISYGIGYSLGWQAAWQDCYEMHRVSSSPAISPTTDNQTKKR